MTATETPEYRKLALDSSNDMIRHDARRGDGMYVEAAWHIFQAGIARARMGTIMFDAGQFARAAEDWLSAGACFYLAPSLRGLRTCVEHVRQLDREGKIPTDRRDLRAALNEREEQLRTLEQKVARFQEEYARIAGPMRTGSQEALDFLLRQLRELPGFPKLHAGIAHQAQQLGQVSLAVTHLDWAEQFDPGSPHLGALRVSLLIASGQPDRAVQLGQELLKAHPDAGYLRVVIAQALLRDDGARYWEAAIEVLQPLMEDDSADLSLRLTAISLAATIFCILGREAEYRRLLDAFDRMAGVIQTPVGKGIVANLRQALPHIFPQPGSNGTIRPNGPDRPSLRQAVEQIQRHAVAAVA
jgi:tetratricopeptide (TPR) repeat protein